MITAPRMELHDSLDTNGQGSQLLPDEALRHLPAQDFNQQTHTAILWEIEDEENHTLAPINGS